MANRGGNQRQRYGRDGESAAAAYLETLGYDLLERNVQCGRWELDLIARTGSTLVFVEVRSRSTSRYGCPSETVGTRKQAHIVNAASLWLRGRRLAGPVRFDVIAVNWEAGRPFCRHFPDAFRSTF
ncbi:MAG: YraN family protein [Candidatus Binatia bacterium]|nr:YraN family protein [Candidatus Binatia bacterium]MDG1958678.1 YraN family protein [Candidatus Binatia bacterium]MDG2009013.1 YraN family protein [Candidatus Binatia bacterium]HAC80068.1 YraN family protein [Deltaproteobacteria bacterium]